MLDTEYPYKNNPGLIRTFSDIGNEIQCIETGAVYGEAIDRYPSRYTYTEADRPVDITEGTEQDSFEALDITEEEI